MVDYPANLFHLAKGKVRATLPPSTPVASQTARDALAKGRAQVAANVTYRDAIIVCIDCEGRHGLYQGDMSKIGITILDTRKLSGLAMQAWRQHHRTLAFTQKVLSS